MTNKKEKIIDTYKKRKIVGVFDKERSKYAFQRYKHRIESNFLKKAINSVKLDKIKVLDVACGTGRMLPEVFSTGKDVEYVGIDTSESMAKHLKEKAKKLGIEKKIKVKIGDASKLPFKDEFFNIVYSFHLLWHLEKEEQEKIIKEMLRICKKGGVIVFDILNRDFIWERTKSFLKIKETGGIYKLDISEIKEYLKGYEISIEKLSDFPIKNPYIYSILNTINRLRKFFPKSLYHMLYLKVKK